MYFFWQSSSFCSQLSREMTSFLCRVAAHLLLEVQGSLCWVLMTKQIPSALEPIAFGLYADTEALCAYRPTNLQNKGITIHFFYICICLYIQKCWPLIHIVKVWYRVFFLFFVSSPSNKNESTFLLFNIDVYHMPKGLSCIRFDTEVHGHVGV